jgi:vacuolar-type H+-ATPase subunit H
MCFVKSARDRLARRAQARVRIEEAQKVHKDDVGGCAQKARELLEQVNRELKEAANKFNTPDSAHAEGAYKRSIAVNVLTI